MKTVLLGLALGLAMGCEKKDEAKPQGRANVPIISGTPTSKKESPKTSPQTTSKPGPNAADQKAGTKLWEFKTGSFVNSSPAMGSDGIVYVDSWAGKLYALNGKTGDKL